MEPKCIHHRVRSVTSNFIGLHFFPAFFFRTFELPDRRKLNENNLSKRSIRKRDRCSLSKACPHPHKIIKQTYYGVQDNANYPTTNTSKYRENTTTTQ